MRTAILLPIALAVAACTSAPPFRPPLASVETVPAGARCVTSDGYVFTTPATVPMRRDGVLRFEVDLEGYERRRVELCVVDEGPSILQAIGLCTFVPVIFPVEPWERVDASDGHTTLRLVPRGAGGAE